MDARSKRNSEGTSAFAGSYFVPGMPHVLRGDLSPSYARLAKAMSEVGEALRASGAERIVYFSTRWIAILGQSFQLRERLAGIHVDEDWHELVDLPYDFRVVRPFGEIMATAAEASGFQAARMDYEGFPVDTATIVADTLVNPAKLPVGMVACSLYSSHAEITELGRAVRRAIDRDGVLTAVVAVSLLSGRYFTTEIDPRDDKVRDPLDDAWNERFLTYLTEGRFDEAKQNLEAYVAETKADSGLKALSFLEGVSGGIFPRPARRLAYGSLYGAGAAVLAF